MAKLRFRSISEDCEEFEVFLEDQDKSVEELKVIALDLLSQKAEEELKEAWK